MKPKDKIFVAGHNGMVGSAIVRKLRGTGFSNLLLADRSQVNLLRQNEVENFFKTYQPDYVFLPAAKVGGILANNTYRADFIYENLMIASNVIHAAYQYKVKKLLFLGSSCIYPRDCPQPIKEEYLLTNVLEKSNEPYAIAKIAGIKLCENYRRQYGCNFISVMPTNLFGPKDNYDLKNSHVIPALISKFHQAKNSNQKSVEIWGTGKVKREFLYVDDLAEGCIFLMNIYNDLEIINIGVGKDITILDLVEMISEVVGFKGELKFDHSKPDGTPRKVLDISKITALGWKSENDLFSSLEKTYGFFQSEINNSFEKKN